MNPEPAAAPIRLSGQGTDRSFYLPRLERENYQGDAVIHWTMPIALRGTGWLNERFHSQFREIMLHATAREGLFCPTYCLMPDHVHLLWMGLRRDSNQRNGMKFLREHLAPAPAPASFSTSGARPRPARGRPEAQCVRENLFLHPGEPDPRQIDQGDRDLAILRSNRARLSQITSAGRRFLAAVLETLPCRAFAECGKHQQIVAADVSPLQNLLWIDRTDVRCYGSKQKQFALARLRR